MTKKGRFKLLYYLVEENLIFYKSLNKSKKLYAFSIFKFSNFYQVIPRLNKFMKRGYFSYYAIQIDTNNKNILGILCFIAHEKTTLIELFNLIYNKLTDYDNSIIFYEEKRLENLFIEPFLENIDFNIKFYKKEKGILIQNHLMRRYLNFYKIQFKNYDHTSQLILELANLIKNRHQKGFIILNFRHFNNKITLDAYFIHIMLENALDQLNFEKEINSIFESNLLKMYDVNLSNMYRILWRLNLADKPLLYNEDKGGNSFAVNQKILNLQLFNLKFEKLLKSNQIEYQRLNQYLTFIEQKLIFMALEKLDIKLILKVFKRFFSKYMIYMLILDDSEYQKLQKIDKIKLLKNLKIWNYETFINTNIKDLKKMDKI